MLHVFSSAVRLFLVVSILLLAICFMVDSGHAGTRLVSTGAEVLAGDDFHLLAGKRVGLVTNQTAVVDGIHLIDALAGCAHVHLVALFAPEHGLRGTEEDGVAIEEGRDPRTGIRTFSLYGRTRKPSPEMLKDVDVLVFDIQDVGSRFYTYISTMGLAMQAAAEAGIPFVVLDRPNPLGGEYVAGPLVSSSFHSFVGMYPIPIAHGLTVGELALMIKGEKYLPGLERLDLTVVEMEGWRRWMQWPDTGREWVHTSPNIPDFATALLYAGLCFFEATRVSEGRGTDEPFHVVGYPGMDALRISAALNESKLTGVAFTPTVFSPTRIPGTSSNPKFRDRDVNGIRISVTEEHQVKPVETAVFILSGVYSGMGPADKKRFFEPKGFDLLAGSDYLRKDLTANVKPAEIIGEWVKDLDSFSAVRKKYLLY